MPEMSNLAQAASPARRPAHVPTPHKIARYGWIPDLPDQRDLMFAAPIETATTLPPSVDLRPKCPGVYDQGQLGSCTANAIAGAIQFEQKKQGLTDFTPSRLMIYYDERQMEGTVASDSGAQIRDGIKSVAAQGACPETMWPYDITQFRTEPSAAAYAAAAKDQVVLYKSVLQNVNQMKSVLASGYPFVFGFTVYQAFESLAAPWLVPLPQPAEAPIGGHAVMAVGYDDANRWFIIRNSWGKGWGLDGYFLMPYSYILQPSLASNFWSIQFVDAGVTGAAGSAS